MCVANERREAAIAGFTCHGRTTRARRFTWKPDGTPDFGVPLPLDAVIPEPSRGR